MGYLMEPGTVRGDQNGVRWIYALHTEFIVDVKICSMYRNWDSCYNPSTYKALTARPVQSIQMSWWGQGH